jgi:hypothetical protein
MSHIDSFKHEIVGLLVGLPVYYPLEDIDGHRGLCQGSAAQGCAGIHRNQRFAQDDPFHISCCTEGRLARDLPEDVLGLGTAEQGHHGAVVHGQVASCLQDPDIIRATGESNAGFRD